MYSRSSIVSSEALTSKSQSDISFGIVGLQSQTSAARATSSGEEKKKKEGVEEGKKTARTRRNRETLQGK